MDVLMLPFSLIEVLQVSQPEMTIAGHTDRTDAARDLSLMVRYRAPRSTCRLRTQAHRRHG
jgi:hypothetical protein